MIIQNNCNFDDSVEHYTGYTLSNTSFKLTDLFIFIYFFFFMKINVFILILFSIYFMLLTFPLYFLIIIIIQRDTDTVSSSSTTSNTSSHTSSHISHDELRWTQKRKNTYSKIAIIVDCLWKHSIPFSNTSDNLARVLEKFTKKQNKYYLLLCCTNRVTFKWVGWLPPFQ